MRRPYGLLVGVLWLGTAWLAFAQQPPSPTDVQAYREPARFTLELHCGECHSAVEPTANPGALGVFDLTEIEWGAGLSTGQMGFILERLRAIEDIEPADLAAVEGYVGARLSRQD